MGVNLDILSDPQSQRFIKELENAKHNLNDSDAAIFFKTVIPHLETEGAEICNAILRTIRALLEKRAAMKAFTKKKIITIIPLERDELAEGLLELILFLAERAPHVLDEDCAVQLLHLAQQSPQKFLVILAVFAEHSKEAPQPLPFANILITAQNSFMNLPLEYAQVIGYAASQVPRFSRISTKCWDILVELLASDSTEVRAAVINAMAQISSIKHSLTIPVDLITEVFDEDPNGVVNLTLTCGVTDDLKAVPLIRPLIDKLEENPMSSLSITRLCYYYQEAAAELFTDLTWLGNQSIELEQRERMLLCAFRYHRLRHSLVGSTEFFKFCGELLASNTESNLLIVAFMLSKLRFTEESAPLITDSQLIPLFVSSVEEIKSESAYDAFIDFVLSIIELNLGKSIFGVCPLICEAVKGTTSYTDKALELLYPLLGNKKWKAKLLSAGIEEAINECRPESDEGRRYLRHIKPKVATGN